MRIDYRWGAGDAERFRKHAAELAALAPDVIMVSGAAVVALQQITRTVPIVFVPGTAGRERHRLYSSEFGISGKWLELLKEMAPRVTRVGILRDPTLPIGIAQFGTIQGMAPSFGVEVKPVDVRDPGEIERGVTDLARSANGGLIVPASTPAIFHRKLIITLAARHRLPAIYAYRFFVADGGLVSYGADSVDSFSRAAGYVDRILKGEKPADLPVQAPTKYELVINLKTAKALGLTLPPTLLARADEVIE